MPKRKRDNNKTKRNKKKRDQKRKQNNKTKKKDNTKTYNESTENVNNYSNPIIFCGDVLFNNRYPLFMVLNTFNIDVCFYWNHNTNYKKSMHFRTLKLNEFKHIKCMKYSSDKLYKYCIKLTINDDNIADNEDVILSFKKNNEMHACYTHFDFMINYQCNPNVLVDDIQNIRENKENHKIDILKKNKECANDKSLFDLMSSVLDLYDKWTQTNYKDDINVSLSSFLKTKLNLNYTNILNCYHQIVNLMNSNTNNNKFKSIKCLNQNCNFNQRIARKRNIEKNTKIYKNQNQIFCDLLDDIHAVILHSTDKHFVRDDIQKKFIVETTKIDDDAKQNDDDAKKSDDPIFAFGEVFAYSEFKDDCTNYIVPEYVTLKQELASNPYYTINANKFNYYYIKSVQLAKSEIFQNIKAKYIGTNNVESEISFNDKITINHIISLLIYCNETEAQKIFKQHTRKLHPDEPAKNVCHRHKFICHWVRYLTESCEFFGQSLSLNSPIYCGIDQKILFDSFSFVNYSPLSTSTNINIAHNFATNGGIILQLQRNGDAICCRYFDMTIISEYAHEKEKFFCGQSAFKIMDIIYDGKSNKKTILALRLLELILNGSLFIYEWNKDLYSSEIQSILLNRLNEVTRNKNKNEYFNKLTKSLILSFIDSDSKKDPFGMKMIWLNIPQITKLNKSLSSYFRNYSFSFLRNADINKITKIHKFTLNKQDMNRLKQIGYHNAGEFKVGTFVVNGYKFDFCLQKRLNPQSKQDRVAMFIRLKSETSSKLNQICFDIVCKEVKYERIKTYAELSKDENYSIGIGLDILFSQIRHLNHLSIDINVRILFDVFLQTYIYTDYSRIGLW